MSSIKGISINPITSFAVFLCLVAATGGILRGSIAVRTGFLALGLLIGLSRKMANVWQQLVMLRMGKLQSAMPNSMVDSLNPGGAALTLALAGQTIAAHESIPVPPAQQQAA